MLSPMPTWDEMMTRRPPPEPRLDIVEVCWRMRSRQNPRRVLECGVYRTDAGLEVRAGYMPDDLLYSVLVIDIRIGRERAAGLRQAVVDKGGFEELTIEAL